MLRETENSFFLTLANMLIRNQVDTESVAKALELICTEFSMEHGILYEVDMSNEFCLAEHYCSKSMSLDEIFLVQEFSPEAQKELMQREFLYTKQGTEKTCLEKQLLSKYHAESVVLMPIVDKERYIDDSWNLYGIVIFLNISKKSSLREEEISILPAALAMLIHYIEVRIFQSRIAQSRDTLEGILDNTGIDIYVNDFYNHDILYVNKSMAAPYGGKEMFEGQKCWRVLFPGQNGPCEFCPKEKIIDEKGIPNKVYTWDYQRAFDGSWFRVFSAAFYWVGGRLAHVVSSADITDNKRNEAIIENLANYDQLTKLPNRRMLLAECERRIDKATQTEQGYVMFFDIDGFKAINDNFGHDAGDEFLIRLGEFFTSIPLLKDSIYRNGGDEFVAVIGGESITKANIKSLANFIHRRFADPWKLKKGDVFCNTSIGVACYPEDGVVAETLLQKADKAMYKVKRSGGGGLLFGYELGGEMNESPFSSPEK